MRSQRREDKFQQIILSIKLWAIEIVVLLVFLKWLGGSLWHELALHQYSWSGRADRLDLCAHSGG
ncbi:MAG: hypothetical protein WB992_07255 [Bryobacteraceae bacterium]